MAVRRHQIHHRRLDEIRPVFFDQRRRLALDRGRGGIHIHIDLPFPQMRRSGLRGLYRLARHDGGNDHIGTGDRFLRASRCDDPVRRRLVAENRCLFVAFDQDVVGGNHVGT